MDRTPAKDRAPVLKTITSKEKTGKGNNSDVTPVVTNTAPKEKTTPKTISDDPQAASILTSMLRNNDLEKQKLRALVNKGIDKKADSPSVLSDTTPGTIGDDPQAESILTDQTPLVRKAESISTDQTPLVRKAESISTDQTPLIKNHNFQKQKLRALVEESGVALKEGGAVLKEGGAFLGEVALQSSLAAAVAALPFTKEIGSKIREMRELFDLESDESNNVDDIEKATLLDLPDVDEKPIVKNVGKTQGITFSDVNEKPTTEIIVNKPGITFNPLIFAKEHPDNVDVHPSPTYEKLNNKESDPNGGSDKVELEREVPGSILTPKHKKAPKLSRLLNNSYHEIPRSVLYQPTNSSDTLNVQPGEKTADELFIDDQNAATPSINKAAQLSNQLKDRQYPFGNKPSPEATEHNSNDYLIKSGPPTVMDEAPNEQQQQQQQQPCVYMLPTPAPNIYIDMQGLKPKISKISNSVTSSSSCIVSKTTNGVKCVIYDKGNKQASNLEETVEQCDCPNLLSKNETKDDQLQNVLVQVTRKSKRKGVTHKQLNFTINFDGLKRTDKQPKNKLCLEHESIKDENSICALKNTMASPLVAGGDTERVDKCPISVETKRVQHAQCTTTSDLFQNCIATQFTTHAPSQPGLACCDNAIDTEVQTSLVQSSRRRPFTHQFEPSVQTRYEDRSRHSDNSFTSSVSSQGCARQSALTSDKTRHISSCEPDKRSGIDGQTTEHQVCTCEYTDLIITTFNMAEMQGFGESLKYIMTGKQQHDEKSVASKEEELNFHSELDEKGSQTFQKNVSFKESDYGIREKTSSTMFRCKTSLRTAPKAFDQMPGYPPGYSKLSPMYCGFHDDETDSSLDSLSQGTNIEDTLCSFEETSQDIELQKRWCPPDISGYSRNSYNAGYACELWPTHHDHEIVEKNNISNCYPQKTPQSKEISRRGCTEYNQQYTKIRQYNDDGNYHMPTFHQSMPLRIPDGSYSSDDDDNSSILDRSCNKASSSDCSDSDDEPSSVQLQRRTKHAPYTRRLDRTQQYEAPLSNHVKRSVRRPERSTYLDFACLEKDHGVYRDRSRNARYSQNNRADDSTGTDTIRPCPERNTRDDRPFKDRKAHRVNEKPCPPTYGPYPCPDTKRERRERIERIVPCPEPCPIIKRPCPPTYQPYCFPNKRRDNLQKDRKSNRLAQGIKLPKNSRRYASGQCPPTYTPNCLPSIYNSTPSRPRCDTVSQSYDSSTAVSCEESLYDLVNFGGVTCKPKRKRYRAPCIERPRCAPPEHCGDEGRPDYQATCANFKRGLNDRGLYTCVERVPGSPGCFIRSDSLKPVPVEDNYQKVCCSVCRNSQSHCTCVHIPRPREKVCFKVYDTPKPCIKYPVLSSSGSCHGSPCATPTCVPPPCAEPPTCRRQSSFPDLSDSDVSCISASIASASIPHPLPPCLETVLDDDSDSDGACELYAHRNHFKKWLRNLWGLKQKVTHFEKALNKKAQRILKKQLVKEKARLDELEQECSRNKNCQMKIQKTVEKLLKGLEDPCSEYLESHCGEREHVMSRTQSRRVSSQPKDESVNVNTLVAKDSLFTEKKRFSHSARKPSWIPQSLPRVASLPDRESPHGADDVSIRFEDRESPNYTNERPQNIPSDYGNTPTSTYHDTEYTHPEETTDNSNESNIDKSYKRLIYLNSIINKDLSALKGNKPKGKSKAVLPKGNSVLLKTVKQSAKRAPSPSHVLLKGRTSSTNSSIKRFK